MRRMVVFGGVDGESVLPKDFPTVQVEVAMLRQELLSVAEAVR